MATQSKEMKKLVLNLEKWRIEHDYSQEEFAKLIKMTPSAYTKLLRGEIISIKADTVKEIYFVTKKLCFILMECCEDEYLKLYDKISALPEDDIEFLHLIVDKMLASQRRNQNETD